MLGQDPRLWFTTHAPGPRRARSPRLRRHAASRRPRRRPRDRAPGLPRPGVPRPGAPAPGKQEPEPFGDEANEIRIACIDIGGGTTDLMIAKYNFESKIDDYIRGQVLHQDGISLGGDQLVKRLLETIIVPAFADSLGLEEEDVQLLFGPEVPRNREIRAQRVNWMNRLFVPLAQAYLNNAGDDVDRADHAHRSRDWSIRWSSNRCKRRSTSSAARATTTPSRSWTWCSTRPQFEGVVYDVFDDLLFDFCQRIVEHETDVVILAGLPSKLGYIQQLVKMYVPLSPSRIVPMHNHYAGNWYPYQDEKGHNPGVIIDPKSPVVVGAAIEFMARHGMLPQFKFDMKGRTHENTYYWGVMTDATSGIRNERILFEPVDEQSREDITEFSDQFAARAHRPQAQRRRRRPRPRRSTCLKIDPGDRIGPTQINVKIKRKHATQGPGGDPGGRVGHRRRGRRGRRCSGENVHFSWRTLADERYYLDTGGLDNIELGKR